ncbi:MAG TPA: alpha/beta hydrolase [Pseudonocardiaceae bacterium]|nr:alpha/beta hydrolase [Pseudonocardiaceae bacterium]
MSSTLGTSSTSDGYRVTPSALTDAASDLTSQASQLNNLASQLTGSTLPAQAFGQLPQSGQVAQAHNTTVSTAGKTMTTASQRGTTLATGLTNSANNYTQGDQTVAGYYRSLLAGTGTSGTRTASGSAGGGAFASQIAANRTKVASALTAEQANQTKLQQQLSRLRTEDKNNPTDDFGRGLNAYQESQLEQQITQSQQKVSLYQDILANNRQIIDFDPSGTGRIAELVGTIGPNTTNVGVLVPGTYTNMADFNTYAKDAASFVQADPSGHLAMVAWADGTFPQSLVPAAADPSYSQAIAPDLASFSHQLRDQINTQVGPGNDVQVTYAGHSYGGAVVGLAEQDGLDANRTLYVESAGMGHNVWSPSDLHDMQPDVRRYAMTAPGDPISAIQGVQVFGLGHGADPNTFPGVTDLATGNYPNGRPITGLAAHNGVFTPQSGAWQNMYGVFTGGPVTPAPPKPAPLVPDPMLMMP